MACDASCVRPPKSARLSCAAGASADRPRSQSRRSVRHVVALCFALRVVGDESGQAFRPVAAVRRQMHAVAPPVVRDLVRQRGVADEGQAQHVDAEVGEAGHAEAGRRRRRGDAEAAVRVVAEACLELRQCLRRGVEIALGFGRQFRMEQRDQRQRAAVAGAQRARRLLPRAGHQVGALAVLARVEALTAAAVAHRVLRQVARRQRALCGGQVDGERVAVQQRASAVIGQRIPGAAGRQEAACFADLWREGGQRVAMAGGAVRRLCADLPAQFELAFARGSGEVDAPLPAVARRAQRAAVELHQLDAVGAVHAQRHCFAGRQHDAGGGVQRAAGRRQPGGDRILRCGQRAAAAQRAGDGQPVQRAHQCRVSCTAGTMPNTASATPATRSPQSASLSHGSRLPTSATPSARSWCSTP